MELKQATKRKYDDTHCLEDSEVNLEKENQQNPTDNLKRAKHVGSLPLSSVFEQVLTAILTFWPAFLQLAVAMATKTASLARELKSLKSNICFMQERCAILDEENRRLRNGVSTGVRPEEDDLVRIIIMMIICSSFPLLFMCSLCRGLLGRSPTLSNSLPYCLI